MRNLDHMGLTNSSIPTNLDSVDKIKSFLSLKLDGEITDIQDLQKIQKLETLTSLYKSKIEALKKQEQDYNDNVQVVVEGDEK